MLILFGYWINYSPICCYKFHIFKYSRIPSFFKKVHEKIFFLSKYFFDFWLSLVLISLYGISQDFSLNFIKVNLRFNTCFRFFVWIICSSLLCKLNTMILTFLSYIFSGKNNKLLWKLCKFFGCWTWHSKKYSSLFLFHFNFDKILIKLKSTFASLTFPEWKLFRNCQTI